MNFMNAVKDTLLDENNVSVTENGALGYRTTGKELLDLNFSVASLRRAEPDEIAQRFTKAYCEDKLTAMKWLFFARDVRGGLGERRLFRTILADFAMHDPDVVLALLSLVPEYGRWDDLWCLLDTPLREYVTNLVCRQITLDLSDLALGKNISLLAKWLPSINASSKKTKRYAHIIRQEMGFSERNYRRMLSRLRRYLNVVEQRMSRNDWESINYEAVPSRANLVYNDAFLRHDEERRRAYLNALKKGEAKINAGTLYPHDIVHKYQMGFWNINPLNETVEALWKALPDTVQGCSNTIVVADGSGSMTTPVDPNSRVTALDVANSLAIYFAERSSGQFRDTYITFSANPVLVDLSRGKTLYDKLRIALSHNEVANTNIEAVFDLILKTAVKNEMPQEDLPQNILIISDMEFDSCATASRYNTHSIAPRLFDEIRARYEEHGYSIPRLVFWNVNSRTGTIPVRENKLGVALVSGFSVNVVKMVMSGELDPYACLLETLNTKRYEPVAEALAPVFDRENDLPY